MHGVYTALITPFDQKLHIDFDAFEKMIEKQISSEVSGVVVCGTTGESPTLSNAEKIAIIKFAKEKIQGRISLIAGAGTNCTVSSIMASQDAQIAGADCTMIVAPYYNKPTQRGMYEHFKSISENIDISIMVYNVPSRTIVDISNQTLLDICALKNILAIKDATGIIDRMVSLKQDLKNNDIALLTGDDGTTLDFYRNGGDGCVSVISNIYPEKWVNMHRNSHSIIAESINAELQDMVHSIFNESNPIPIKYAASKMAMCANTLRPPLTQATYETQELIDRYIKTMSY